jgi:hypothetical protein
MKTDTYFCHISSNSTYNENVPDKIVQTLETYFVLNKFFFRKSCLL